MLMGVSVGILNAKTNKGVYLSTPLMLTWGVNEFVDGKTGSKSYDFALKFLTMNIITQVCSVS